MAVRATQDLKNAIIKTYLVKAGVTATAGRYVKFGATDTEVDNAGAGDDALAVGVALETKAAGTRVQVCLTSGSPICPVLVGTGGATRGQRLKLAADGVTDVTAAADKSVGSAVQSGAVGDLIGATVAKA